MAKRAVYESEKKKLTEVFSEVEESKRKLVEGLIEDACFLRSENHVLKVELTKTGMVNFHPTKRELQKPVEASRQYLRNVNSYSVIIKTLNGVLNKNILDDDDELSEFE